MKVLLKYKNITYCFTLKYIIVQVDTDAHNRNREILETMLPRESPSRQIDFATFISVSFPAFALSNGNDQIANKLYHKTKKEVIANLSSVSILTTSVSLLMFYAPFT